MRLARRPFLIGAAAVLAAAPAHANDFAYRDWNFNTSAVKGPLPEALIASLQAQIDLVERANIRPEILRFFRGFDVKVDPDTLGKSAFYVSKKQRSRRRGATVHRIYLSTEPVSRDVPVLLRMLLLAYFDRRMHADDNARVEAFYDEAGRAGTFTLGAEVMEGPSQFFAYCATAILIGSSRAEALTRAKVRERAPRFYAWIVGELCVDGRL